MTESGMQINKLEEENQQLINKIKELEQRNKLLEEELEACNNNTIIHNLNLATNKTEDKPLTYEQWLDTEEGDNLANAYAETINIDVSEEVACE